MLMYENLRQVAWLWEEEQHSTNQQRSQTAPEEASDAPEPKGLCTVLATVKAVDPVSSIRERL